jgi:hybrid cluster-associated redox disulfide protein
VPVGRSNFTRCAIGSKQGALRLDEYSHGKEKLMATISKEMSIGEVVQKYPQTIEVFLRHGLMCFGCAIARFENIEQGAVAHGIAVEPLMKDLNAAVVESATGV